MRVVRSAAELDDALEAAEREAEGAFGDGTLYCERYLERPRHVEVQLLADAHGRVVAVGERDCSVQRRHQKVLEEAPAPGLSPALREALHDAAVAFGRAIGYRSAGTVEFVARRRRVLLPRAERPHPGRAPRHRGRHRPRPRRRAAPYRERRAPCKRTATRPRDTRSRCDSTPRTPGRFSRRPGASSASSSPRAGVRVDAGVEEGDEVGLAYDPMIAKLVAHGPTRDDALDALAAALAETRRRRRRRRTSRSCAGSSRTRSCEPETRRRRSSPSTRRSRRLPVVRAPAPCSGRRGGSISPLRLPPPPPDVDVESHRPGAAHGREHGDRADARHRDPGRGRAGRPGRARASRSSSSRR